MALEPAPLRPAPARSLWAELAAAGPDEFYDRWLATLCAQLPEVRAGLVVLRPEPGAELAPVAMWPDQDAPVAGLGELIERALAERCGLLGELAGEAEPDFAAAYPICTGEEVHALVAVRVSSRAQARLEDLMGRLEWGSGLLASRLLERLLAEQGRAGERLAAVHDLLACVLGEEGFEAAGAKLVSELAALMGCDRVSVGYLRRARVRVRLLSHSAQFAKRMDLVRAIEGAMGEAVEQRRTLVLPPAPGEERHVLRAHAGLARRWGSGSLLTVPLYRGGECYAAVTLERPAERPFTAEEVRQCEAIAALAGAALEDRRRNDRWLGAKAWEAARGQLARLLGAGYVGRKLALVTGAVLLAFLALAEGEYRLAADATLEGAVQRAVAAPFEGYIERAPARAGDLVAEGELLAALDTRELRLERLKWISQRAQLRSQRQEALGARDRARVRIVAAQIAEAEAELELVESRLAHSELRAPFAGLVVSGDLSQRLGGPVRQGEVLFEVTPLERYRLIMRVPERRIDDVAVGQRGRLLLSALPREPFPLEVTRITPVTVAENGSAFFRVEARLARASTRLRPGMEGVAKIDVDRRLLASIWGRDLLEWLRLRLWRLWG